VELFVVGDQATIDKNLDDIGALLASMNDGKYISAANNDQFKDSRNRLSKEG